MIQTEAEEVSSGIPRLGPEPAEYSRIGAIHDAAQDLGISLRPWQDYAADVITSTDADGQWLYREAAVIAARQNGKTKILLPRIKAGLDRGERIIHTAQNRLLPRATFREVAK